MQIKSKYYEKIEKILKEDVEKALKKYPDFREELFDKLYTFFKVLYRKRINLLQFYSFSQQRLRKDLHRRQRRNSVLEDENALLRENG